MVDWSRYVEDPEPTPPAEVVATKVAKVGEKSAELEDDYRESRQDITTAMEIAQSSLLKLASLAQSSDHPRSYEALSALLKTISDMAQSRLDIHERRAKIVEKTKEKDAPSSQTNTQNNFFIGSNAELEKLLENGNINIDLRDDNEDQD